MNALQSFAVLFVLLTLMQWWVLSVIRFWKSRSAIHDEPRQPVPWGLADLVMTFFLQGLAHSLAHELFRGRHQLESKFELHQLELRVSSEYIGWMGTASLSATALTVLWLIVRYRPSGEDFGVQLRRVGSDLWLGIRTFLMLAPLVYGIQLVLTQFVKSEHPLIEMIKKNPSPRFFLMSGFAAVIVAPLAEEFIFRLLLQGWFERLALGRDSLWEVIIGAAKRAGNQERGVAEFDVESERPSAESLPRSPTDDTAGNLETVVKESHRPPSGFRLRWPIFASAALFALAHISNGPDPIPLFVLALGLGYLYQTTHRILPSIVVHFLLNATTIVLMWLTLRQE